MYVLFWLEFGNPYKPYKRRLGGKKILISGLNIRVPHPGRHIHKPRDLGWRYELWVIGIQEPRKEALGQLRSWRKVGVGGTRVKVKVQGGWLGIWEESQFWCSGLIAVRDLCTEPWRHANQPELEKSSRRPAYQSRTGRSQMFPAGAAAGKHKRWYAGKIIPEVGHRQGEPPGIGKSELPAECWLFFFSSAGARTQGHSHAKQAVCLSLGYTIFQPPCGSFRNSLSSS